jgi:hypothetical protein
MFQIAIRLKHAVENLLKTTSQNNQLEALQSVRQMSLTPQILQKKLTVIWKGW